MYSKYYIVLSYHKNHFVRKIFLFLKNPSTYFVPLKSFCKKCFSKKKKKKSKEERERHYSINGKKITNVRLA
jgi:uncharacterized OB-fold protein